MMNQSINEEFMGQWKNMLKTPFSTARNVKHWDAFLNFYKKEQENMLMVMTAWQNYAKNNKPNGNAGDIGKLWQQHLELSHDLIDSLDSYRQNRRKALFSFFKALVPQIPRENAATNK